MATIARAPTSDESVTGAWTGSVGSRYTLVDDYPDTVPTDVLDSPTATGGAQITFGFSAFSIPAGSTGISVQVQYYDRDVTNGNNNAGARLKVGGSYFNSATHNPTTTLTAQSNNFATNPKTAVAWTVDDINGVGANALQAFGFNSTDASPALRFSSVQLQVTYTPPAFSLTVADATQAQTADNTVLTAHVPAFILVIQDAGQGQPVDNLDLTAHGPHANLVIGDAGQAQTAEGVVLIQHGVLTVADASQLQAADNTVLTAHVPTFTLVTQDASQLHAADNTVLTAHVPTFTLVIQDTGQSQTVDNTVLIAHVPTFTLVMQDVVQAQTSEDVTLTPHAGTPVPLTIQDAVQDQGSGNVTLTQNHLLSISEIVQSQFSDHVTLTAHTAPEGPSFELIVQDAGQAHESGVPDFTQHGILDIAGAIQLQSAENVTLLAHLLAPVLDIEDGVLSQNADVVDILGLPSHGPGPVTFLTGSYSEWDLTKTENWW